MFQRSFRVRIRGNKKWLEAESICGKNKGRSFNKVCDQEVSNIRVGRNKNPSQCINLDFVRSKIRSD